MPGANTLVLAACVGDKRVTLEKQVVVETTEGPCWPGALAHRGGHRCGTVLCCKVVMFAGGRRFRCLIEKFENEPCISSKAAAAAMPISTIPEDLLHQGNIIV